MKKHFEIYGEVVSFDYTFSLIKNPHPSGKKWKVGFFLASSSCKRITPLAIAISLNDNTESYCQVFRTFMKAMRGRPRVLVTD